MTTQPVEANVVLTADNSQYDQAMIASAGSTSSLGNAVDSLGKKISGLTKAAGKTLIGISAADVTLIGAAVTAWASYEKQMSRLQAQSAIISRTQDQQTRVMKDYTTAVKGLRTEYGTTTAEASKLVETLAKVTSVRQTRDLSGLSKVFVDMSKATGESSEGLATSMVNLQQVMGKEVNTSNSRKYADMFTHLSSQTNSSAQGLIDFTAQLAPMGEQMGMNTKQIAGFATAFNKAGQEGIGASNVFAKIASDITNSVATGSPELKNYANLIGVTTRQFKEMAPSEQMLQIFEKLASMGPRATAELQRMGLDSIRSQRSVTAVLNQPGGVRAALGEAEVGVKSGAAAEGAAASMQGLTDEFEKLREEMKLMAETLATWIGPAFAGFVSGVEKVASNINEVLAGPMGDFLQVIMAIVAPLTGGAGALLLFAGALTKVAAAFMGWRNSMSLGVREGMRGGAGITTGPGGGFVARGGPDAMLGPRGAQLAAGGSTWLQRGMYNIGQAQGAALGGVGRGVREGWFQGRERWNPEYTRPTESRSGASYVAGGLGRALDFLVTPQFDQMRTTDPTKRTRSMLFSQFPKMPAGTFDEAISARQGSLAAQDKLGSAQAVYQATMGTDPMAEARAAAEVNRATKAAAAAQKADRAASAMAAEQVKAAQAQARNTRAMEGSTTGFSKLGRAVAGVGGALAGGAAGGARAAWPGIQAIGRSPMAAPIGGTLAMAGMGMAGVESNALMFGALGASMGGVWGAAAGGVVGAGLDMAGANDDLQERADLLNENAKAAQASGLGLGEMNKEVESTKKATADLEESFKVTSAAYWKDPTVALGSVKNSIEWIFGESDIQELEKDQSKASESIRQTENAVRSLGKEMGKEFTGSRNSQMAQMDEFISTEGQARLAQAKVTFEDYTAAMRKGGQAWQEMQEKVGAPGKASGLWDRLQGTAAGRAMLETPEAMKALTTKQGDIAQQYKAVDATIQTMRDRGMSTSQMLRSATRSQDITGVEGAPEYMIQQAIAQRMQQEQAIAAPTLTRAQGLQQTIQTSMDLTASLPTTGPRSAEAESARMTAAGAFAEQVSYIKQLLLAQEQFEISRDRAEEDYNLSRTYALYDFDLQRERSEENFNRMRGRATADYWRSVRRANYDYNLQRGRQEQDFHHQVQIMAKQQAQSVYNIYERVQTERTHSASWLLANAGDQLERMREQAENLDKLRGRGLSDTAIQQMQLTDPQKAQQLASLVVDLTPQMIRQFNRVAGAERVKAAKDLVTDPSSLEWQEMRRSFNLARNRAAEDFERGMRLSRQDFRRGMRQQQADYNIMMDDQLEDFETSMERQEKAYNKQMKRAAEDMANMAKEVDGTLNQVLRRGVSELSGHAQEQARAVLQSFRDLKNDTRPEAIALMEDLASIFGFKYTAPKANEGRPSPGMRHPGTSDATYSGGGGHAEGGVIPGWTPGRDTTTTQVSGGEAIMRPEWTRAVGEKNIEAMNHQARYGGFFLGGVMPLQAGALTNFHGTNYHGADWAGDLNGPMDLASPPAKVMAWKTGRVANVQHLNDSYGNYIEMNHPGSNQNSLYAHLSSIAVNIGDLVRSGQMLGRVGNTGNSFGAHLHFELDGGGIAMGDVGTGATGAGAMTGRGIRRQVLKDWYAKAEKAAYAMDGVHPLDPGMISEVINRFARRKIRSLGRKHGFPADRNDNGMMLPADAEYGGNATGVWRALTAAGFNKIHTAGIMGNMQSESGFDPFIVQGGGHSMNPADAGSGGYGLVQWTPGAKLIPYLHGHQPSVATEVNALREQLAGLGTSPEGAAGAALRSANSIRDATLAFELQYERHAGAAQPNRISQAYAIHNKYAADGAIVDGRQNLTVGEAGPEAVIPLNARGADFMAEVMGATMGGRNVMAAGGGMSVYNTRIDRSTNFTGPITVQANDPQALITKLQARQRVMALSRPSLTGSAA